MKNFKQKTHILLIAILTLFAACSSDDDGGGSGPSGNNTGPHHYDITIGGQNYEADVENNSETLAGTSSYGESDGQTTVTFSLNDDNFSISGHFNYPNGSNDNIPLDEGDNEIDIAPDGSLGDGPLLVSQSGSASVEPGEKFTLSGTGVSYREIYVELSGTFISNENGEEVTQDVSGNVKINLPPGF